MCKIPQKFNKNIKTDCLCVTKQRRLVFSTENKDCTNVLIATTIKELEQIIKKAKLFEKSSTYKKFNHYGHRKCNLYFRHLSPDVSFAFNLLEKTKK